MRKWADQASYTRTCLPAPARSVLAFRQTALAAAWLVCGDKARACVRAVAQSPSPSYTLPARRQRRAVWRAFSAAPRLAAGTAHAAGPLLAGFGHRPCFLGSEGGRLAGVQLPGSSPPSLSSSSSQACYLPEAVSRPPRRDQGSEERPVGRCRQAATRVPPPVQPSGEERSGTFLR